MYKKNNIPWNKGKKGLQTNPNKKKFSKDILNKLYVEDKLSLRQVAKILKTNKSTIANRLREYSIPIRSSIAGENIRILQKGFRGGNWKGGRLIHKSGYVDIWIKPNSPFYSMARNIKSSGGYVKEHRLVVAESINRCLKSWEHVHHKNRIKSDNKIENLEIINNIEHSCFHRQLTSLKKEVEGLKGLLLLILLSRETINR